MKRLLITEDEKKYILGLYGRMNEQLMNVARTQFLNLNQSKKTGSVPFKNEKEGNEFRKWVNDNYKEIASHYDLDPTGSYNNIYIQSAYYHELNTKNGKKKLGDLYNESKPSNLSVPPPTLNLDKFSTERESTYVDAPKSKFLSQEKIKSEIMKSAKVPSTIPGAERINKEIEFINKREEYKDKPFFILDYYYNLVLAFDKNHNLIDWSQSIAGASEQPSQTYTYTSWCEETGKGLGLKGPFEFVAPKCLDKNTNKTFELQYGTKMTKSQAQGIYQTKGFDPKYGESYYGKEKGGLINIQTLWGEELGTAIHVPAVWAGGGRDKAMSDLSSTLSKTPGRISPEYISKVTGSKKYDLSSGCFNVKPEFILNPKIKEISKNAFIFIMGGKENYLVDSSKEYFNELGSGDNCKNPNAVANQLGEKIYTS
jgi:hypothetical protein